MHSDGEQDVWHHLVASQREDDSQLGVWTGGQGSLLRHLPRSRPDQDQIKTIGNAEYADLDYVLQKSDFISVHVPLQITLMALKRHLFANINL